MVRLWQTLRLDTSAAHEFVMTFLLMTVISIKLSWRHDTRITVARHNDICMMTFSITTFSITTLIIRILRIMKFSIKTFCIKTFCIFATQLKDIHHNNK